MKNVSMSINPFAAPAPFPAQPVPQFPVKELQVNYTVAFSAQFTDAEEAMMFAKFMLSYIKDYKGE